MSEMVRELRYGLKALARQPAVSLVVVLTLALGIGANTALFSVVDALLLRPFPIPDIERLVQVWETLPERAEDRRSVAPANFLDWQRQSRVFEHLVAAEWWDANLTDITGQFDPERLQGYLVSPQFFDALGLKPELGRTFLPEEATPGRERVAVIGHGLWSRRFASDPALVGGSVIVDGLAYTVVGIAPQGFDYPFGTEIWAPLAFDEKTAAWRDRHYLNVIGRLKDEETLEDARAEMELIATRLAQHYPDTNAGEGVNVMALRRAVVDEGSPNFLIIWQASVLFVLFIACVNVANLQFARGADRQRELAIRIALGAGRFRVIRQLLTESLVLSLAGGALSLAFAWVGAQLIRSNMPANIARFIRGWSEIDVDGRLIGLTLIVAVVAGLAAGVLPAWQASQAGLTEALREGGRSATSGVGRRRLRNVLVVAEVGLALMLLVAAGLTIRGTVRMLRAPQGYDPDRLLTLTISLPEKKYAEASTRREFYRDVLAGSASLGEAVAVAAVNNLPSGGSSSSRRIIVEGRPVETAVQQPSADYRVITPNYFETLRIPLLNGRAFTETDREGSPPVAIISEGMARRFWPEQDAIGKRFQISTEPELSWLTVVGVAGDVMHDWFLSSTGRIRPTFYRPFAQDPGFRMTVAIRTRGEPTSLTPAVRSQIRRVAPDQPVYAVRSMRRVLSDRLLGPQYAATLMGVFGAIALVLAAVGVYGVMSYSVARRTHEIGVRVALGAARRDVLWMTIGQGLRLATVGVAVGLLLALALGQVMASALFGVVSLDAATFVGFTAVLLSAALLASYLPARRALRVDPIVALRVE